MLNSGPGSRDNQSHYHNRSSSRHHTWKHRSPCQSRQWSSTPNQQDSLTLNTDHMYFDSVTNSTPKEDTILTDKATDGHTSFHTTIELSTKASTKALKVKTVPMAYANIILLSCYRNFFPKSQQVWQSQQGARQPTESIWVTHNCVPQSFIGQFIINIHISQAVTYPTGFHILKDTKSPPNSAVLCCSWPSRTTWIQSTE